MACRWFGEELEAGRAHLLVVIYDPLNIPMEYLNAGTEGESGRELIGNLL